MVEFSKHYVSFSFIFLEYLYNTKYYKFITKHFDKYSQSIGTDKIMVDQYLKLNYILK